MFFILAFVLSLNLVSTHGSQCTNLLGKWRNELGSDLIINQFSNNRLTGEYRTVVERKPGAAAVTSNVTGTSVPLKEGALLAFTVLFNDGESLATWVGQCIVCAGKETLFTSYVLRHRVKKAEDKWLSTIINQNIFRRPESGENDIVKLLHESETLNEISSDSLPQKPADLSRPSGEWISDTGDKIEFVADSGRYIRNGKYRGSPVIGHFNDKEDFKAFGFVTASSKSVKGWAGHVYGKLQISDNMLETSWLEHIFNPSCKDPRNMVHFGMDNFKRLNADVEISSAKSNSLLEKIRIFFKSLF